MDTSVKSNKDESESITLKQVNDSEGRCRRFEVFRRRVTVTNLVATWRLFSFSLFRTCPAVRESIWFSRLTSPHYSNPSTLVFFALSWFRQR